MATKFFVFVSEGCVREVYDEEGDFYNNWELIDFDCLEDGRCPICQGNVVQVEEETRYRLASQQLVEPAGNGVWEPVFDEDGEPVIIQVQIPYTVGGRSVCDNCGFDWDNDDSYENIIKFYNSHYIEEAE